MHTASKGLKPPRGRGGPLDWPKEILERYHPAIRVLRRALHELPPGELLELEYRLVNECEAALRAEDRHAPRRRSDWRSIERARSLAKAAKTVAGYMREYPDQAGFIAGGALAALRERGLRIAVQSGREVATPDGIAPSKFVPDHKPVLLSQAVALLAEQLARSAVEHNPARRGPWAHRPSIPGAMFSEPLDDARHNKFADPATVLGFHLVFRLRASTAKASSETMPVV